MSFHDTVRERFADWNYCHPLILAAHIRAMKPDVVVEVGSYRGFGACHMAHALQENSHGKLYCIDNWTLTEHVSRYGDPRAHFEEGIRACGVDAFIEITQGESHDPAMWPSKVDVCYVDAWHSFTSAMKDFLMAHERGARLIALDDTENCVGPRMVVDALRRDPKMAGCYDILEIHSDNGMVMLMRREVRRPVTFSQEIPYPCVGIDLRPLTLGQQAEHFKEAAIITKLDYSDIATRTEHDTIL